MRCIAVMEEEHFGRIADCGLQPIDELLQSQDNLPTSDPWENVGINLADEFAEVKSKTDSVASAIALGAQQVGSAAMMNMTFEFMKQTVDNTRTTAKLLEKPHDKISSSQESDNSRRGRRKSYLSTTPVESKLRLCSWWKCLLEEPQCKWRR